MAAPLSTSTKYNAVALPRCDRTRTVDWFMVNDDAASNRKSELMPNTAAQAGVEFDVGPTASKH
jgi:hypothetical protein